MGRSWIGLRVSIVSAVTGFGLVATGAGVQAGSATARTIPCVKPALLRAIEGTTVNATGDTLRSVYREEGWGSHWGPEPAKVLAPHESYDWCNVSNTAPFTTAAMRVEYALPDGDKVVIQSFIAFFGSKGASCYVTGPSPSAFKCSAIEEPSRALGLLVVKFEIST
jgi:hypothetical protein